MVLDSESEKAVPATITGTIQTTVYAAARMFLTPRPRHLFHRGFSLGSIPNMASRISLST